MGGVDLIREFRTRLVADVVTGKLDVREAAAKLPDESRRRRCLMALTDRWPGDESEEATDLDAELGEDET